MDGLFLAVLGPCGFACDVSNWGEQRLLLIVELFTAVTSLAVEHAPGAPASVVAALELSSCGLPAPARRLSSCGPQASLLLGAWSLPRPGIKPMSPALAGRFSSRCATK